MRTGEFVCLLIYVKFKGEEEMVTAAQNGTSGDLSSDAAGQAPDPSVGLTGCSPHDQQLLTALIFGAVVENNPAEAAEFAVRLAICAQMTGGDQQRYGRAVRKAVVEHVKLTEIFPRAETEAALREFWRAVRNARNNPKTIDWLATKFQSTQQSEAVLEFLWAAERALTAAF